MRELFINEFKNLKPYKKIIICLSPALVLALAGSIAFLQRQASLTNTFAIGTVTPQINETFNDEKTVKSDVSLSNKGNVPVYMRCKVDIYYKNDDGTISADPPVETTDYTLTYADDYGEKWIKKDNIYYYKSIVNANGKTSDLIKKCVDTDTNSGKKLVVDINAEAIQAEPASAVEEAWSDIKVTNGVLEAKSS